jgi:broad specificity phosphatase PhoE
VRHGSVDAGDIAYGDLDVQLSEIGREETRRAAARLAALTPTAVRSSPLSRARALGEAVAERAGVPLTLDARLAEVRRGAWQGLARRDYLRRWGAAAEAFWRDPLHWCQHEGESEHALRTRVVAALTDALTAPGFADGGTLVVAAHRQALRALVGAALGLPAAASHGLVLDPAHAILLVDEHDGWTLSRTNLPDVGAPQAAEPADGPPRDVLPRPNG